MSTTEQQAVASDALLARGEALDPGRCARGPLMRLADSRAILLQVLTPNAAPRRLLPQLAGLLGAAWLQRRVWQPFLGSELPLWRRAAGLLLALWPTPSQRKRGQIARLVNHSRTPR